MEATIPIGIAARGVIYPAAGVTVASPAIAPVTVPRIVGRRYIQLIIIQVKAAAAAAVLVVTKALAARPPEGRALPALKPNQPNQSSPAPRTTMGILLGSIMSRGNTRRRPSRRTSASAEIPALRWTTEPPAKSSTPSLASPPPLPQTQCA